MTSLRTRKPRALDLFCGAGGLTEGLTQAGYKVIGAVDIDSLACRTYRRNHPHVKVWEGDLSSLSGTAMMAGLDLRRGDLDLLAACPPCQGFSTLRTVNGSRLNRDPRNHLIYDVLRIIRSTRPKAVMLENVPKLARSRQFAVFRKSLGSMGYHVRWAILNAFDFGVPQRRRRLVLIASRVGIPAFAKPAPRSRTVRDAISRLTPPDRSRDPLHNYFVRRKAKTMSLIRRIPRNGGSRSALGQDQLDCHKDFNGFRDVYGRMSWEKPAPTITGGCINPSKGRFLHPIANRPITLREAALLQSFPKSYQFLLDKGRYAVALMIGNALPPEFVRRHAESVRVGVKQSAVPAD